MPTAKKPKALPAFDCPHCIALRGLIAAAGTDPVPVSSLFLLLGGCPVWQPAGAAIVKLSRLERAAAKDGSAKMIGHAAGYRRALLDLGMIRK